MTFEIIEPPKSKPKIVIGDDEVVMSTTKGRGMMSIRFGPKAIKRLGLGVGSIYVAMWGAGDDIGKLRIRSAGRGHAGWELKKYKNRQYPEFCFSKLPVAYQGRIFKGNKLHAEFVTPQREQAYVQFILPRDFFEAGE